jgi:hypothetical protein
MKIKSKELTSENCIISMDRLKTQNGFTKEDMAIHDQLFNTVTEPAMFDNTILHKKFGVKFLKRKLVPLSELDTNDIYGDSVRDGINPKYKDIDASISMDGFKLNQLMPCAYWDDIKNKWVILEGRTRISILKAHDISGNLLVNEYEKTDRSIPDSVFALHSNTVASPAGFASEADMMMQLTNMVSGGFFEFDDTINQDLAKKEFKKEVKSFAKEKYEKIHLSTANLDKIMGIAMNSKNVNHNIKHFPSLEHATAHLNTVLGVRDDKKYVYVLTSTDEWDFFKRVIPILEKMRENKDNRSIRIVTCKLKLKDSIDWYLANLRVGRKMDDTTKAIIEYFGGTVGSATPQIEVYGTIPQCEVFANKYPMDKLVRYSKVTKAEYNLYGEKVDF